MNEDRKPSWLKTPMPRGDILFKIKRDLRDRKLATVCEEAKCPNISECWGTNTATFMICGDTCTRACRFCHVKTGNPGALLDPAEPQNVAQSVQELNLDYVVITMVDRDDLPDAGAAHIAAVLDKVRDLNPQIRIEFLSGDLAGKDDALATVLATGLEVFAHNLETVERLTPRVRDARATYRRSLAVLDKALATGHAGLITKSAVMLGLGETEDEVLATLKDMRNAGVGIVTIGQYMRPTKKHLSVKEWVDPARFVALKEAALGMGFRAAVAGPLVRSSYKARDVYVQAQGLN